MKKNISTIILDKSQSPDIELKQGEALHLGIIFHDDKMVFPDMPAPLPIDNANDEAIYSKAIENNEYVFHTFLKGLKSPSEPTHMGVNDFYRYGVILQPMRIVPLPDGEKGVLCAAKSRGYLKSISKGGEPLTGKVYIADFELEETDRYRVNALHEKLYDIYTSILEHLSDSEKQEIKDNLTALSDEPVRQVFYMMSSSPLNTIQRAEIFQTPEYEEMLEKLIQDLLLEKEKLMIQHDVMARAQMSINDNQRQMFLQHQLQTIKEDLGIADDESEIKELRDRIEAAAYTDEKLNERLAKEVRKLERYNPSSPDYSVQYTYIDTLLGLPWEKTQDAEIDMSIVREQLDSDHYGLDKVKERILEYTAVMKLRNDMKAPIICLYGPPGVGKTSLGKSIAKALGREYARISLGGLHDEAEIRGHRRTYIGALPGRVMSAVAKAGTRNPVLVLDEIDKIGNDYKGDPSQALLEVLDPEQNYKFHDNYVDIDFDLSGVLFIATANDLSTISRPLLDRMEIIEIPGYAMQEKLEIGRRHIVPKVLDDLGMSDFHLKLSDDALLYIINHYTRESGVRQLEKKISSLFRKIAVSITSGKEYPENIEAEDVKKLLGREEVNPDMYEGNEHAGVVTGLAWTAAGGEILFIETSLAPGKGDKLTLTGNLGDVMKESATIALQWIRANGERFGVTSGMIDNNNVHIHVPEGAVPKDGPSAGITMVTSLVSAFTGRKVRPRLAMTGEISLRGKVLPVGGIKEKLLGAKRSGISTVILSEKNRRDVEEINIAYLDGMDFHYVDTIDDVLNIALI